MLHTIGENCNFSIFMFEFKKIKFFKFSQVVNNFL